MTSKDTDLKNEKLAKAVMALSKPKLESQKKDALKKHLLLQLDLPQEQVQLLSFKSIIQSIRLAVRDLKLETVKRVDIKERVFSYIEGHTQRKFFFSNLFAFHKKLLSLAMVFMLVFGLIGFINIETNVVRAATFTKLGSFEGGVLLERDGEFVDIYPGIEIHEKDKIITGEDGQAVIEYFDDSVSRLASDSQLLINELRGDSFRSRVSISLLDGAGWFKVINLVESHSAFVVEAADVYTSAYRAAFNVEVDENDLEIGVFNNSVDVRSGQDKEKVVSGEKMVVDSASKEVKSVKKLDAAEKEDQWVKDNLESDKIYLTEVDQRLLSAKIEAVGIDLDDDFSLENSLREDTLLFLTFDDVKKEKIELNLAEKDFIAAQIKLHNEDLTTEEKVEAQEAIAGFSDEVQEFYDLVDEVSTTDEVYGEELEQYVEEKILTQKKDLLVVLPQSPIYEVKEVVDDLELLTADDETDLIEIMADQVVEKLASAEELDESVEHEDLASEVVEDYKEVLDMIGELPEENKGLTEDIASDFAFFEATDIISSGDFYDLKSEVAKIVGDEPVQSFPSEVVSPVLVDDTFNPEKVEDVVEVVTSDPEQIIRGPYGVEIKGDKPLPPFLQDIQMSK